ncbi:MAG: tRNA lysidine(34) synthetase TilS, partial [Omnitrophica bacterium RBG_13_46_9]
LYVAHLDHGMRGGESRRDARFVKDMAGKARLGLVLKKISPTVGKSKLSLEERLREKRYAFFKEACRKTGAGVVATAHTLDDQAETVLMRIVKGASLKGLVGIHPVRVDKNLRFIRPLIEIEKKDITRFLKRKNIPFRTDRTNFENRFLRNAIRNKVLPYLEKYNPCVKRSLSNLADSLREDYEFIEEEKHRRRNLIRPGKYADYILLRDILLQPKALQREIVREALKRAGANIKKLTFRHWKDFDVFMRTREKGKSLDLPGSVRVVKAENRLVFVR